MKKLISSTSTKDIGRDTILNVLDQYQRISTISLIFSLVFPKGHYQFSGDFISSFDDPPLTYLILLSFSGAASSRRYLSKAAAWSAFIRLMAFSKRLYEK